MASYDRIDSPIGSLFVIRSEKGICYLGFECENHEEILAAHGHPSMVTDEDARSQLGQYFAGTRQDFTLPLDPAQTTQFQEGVHAHLRKIPYGSTMSYTELADVCEKPRAVRAIGSACGANPLPLLVPCHRVVRSDGSLGGYRGGLEAKQFLLGLEASY